MPRRARRARARRATRQICGDGPVCQSRRSLPCRVRRASGTHTRTSTAASLFLGDKRRHHVDVHFRLQRDAGDFGGDLGPVIEFGFLATNACPGGAALRLIVGVGLMFRGGIPMKTTAKSCRDLGPVPVGVKDTSRCSAAVVEWATQPMIPATPTAT